MANGPIGVRPERVAAPGGTWDASVGGIVPVSGQIGALSGPWYIEQQWMTIDYTRIPHFNVSSTTPSLSGYDTGYNIDHTELFSIITAHHERRKVYENHSVSTFTQGQKFIVDAVSADPYGTTYGSLNTSTLGPQGKVLTSQPYYFRRDWYITDTEAICDLYGSNIAVGASALDSTNCMILRSNEQTSYWKDFDRMSAHPWDKGALVRAIEDPTKLRETLTTYPLAGGYSVAQETFIGMINYIHTCGALVTGWEDSLGQIPRLYEIPAQVLPLPNNHFYPSAQCINYNNNHHDYT